MILLVTAWTALAAHWTAIAGQPSSPDSEHVPTVIVVLALLVIMLLRIVMWRVLRSLGRRSRRLWARRSREPIAYRELRYVRRFADVRRKRVAQKIASTLVELYSTGIAPRNTTATSHFVLEPGEYFVGRVTAGFAHRAYRTRAHVSWRMLPIPWVGWGHVDSYATAHPLWFDHDWSEWDITNLRIAGLSCVTEEMISAYWCNVATLDLQRRGKVLRMIFADGSAVAFYGPDVSIIAVVAVACCYGPQALATHPIIKSLRLHRGSIPALRQLRELPRAV